MRAPQLALIAALGLLRTCHSCGGGTATTPVSPVSIEPLDAGAINGGGAFVDAGPDSHYAPVLIDNEPDDNDTDPLGPGTPFTGVAFTTAPACSRRTYASVNDCYNELNPPAPSIVRSLIRPSEGAAADTLPYEKQVPEDGSVNNNGKIQGMPSTRSTSDGRVMIAGGCDGCDALQFRVYRPENVGYDLTVADSTRLVTDLRPDLYNWIGAPQNRLILWDPVKSALRADSTDSSGNLHLPGVLQNTLCEESSDRISSGLNGNVAIAEDLPSVPRTCNARYGENDPIESGDCYDVSVLVGANVAASGTNRWELRSTALTLFIRNPKRGNSGQSSDAEGETNFVFAYPRNPTGATTTSGVQTLPPFIRFEFNQAFSLVNGAKQISCPDANGNDLTGVNWWECFGGSYYPNANKFIAQFAGPNGACYDVNGNAQASHPGYCEYFYQQHQAASFNVDDDGDGTLGNGHAWSGKASNCGKNETDCQNGWAMFEAMTTGDGQMLLLNIKGLYYSYNTIGPCRADGFTSFEPISWMPGDPAVNTRYDIAKSTGGRPFRDSLGNDIPYGMTNPGAYAWIDRRGRNLFYAAQNAGRDGYFATQARTYDYSGNPTGVRNIAGAQPTAAERPLLNPDRGPGTQYALMGSWTNGKAVIVDEINAADFGGGDQDANLPANTVAPRTGYSLQLYSGMSGPLAYQSKGVQGFGSFEHMFNQFDALEPTLPFDVVWHGFTDIQRNMEIAFDPYLNPHALVVAHMNAPLQMSLPPRDGSGNPTQASFVRDGFIAHQDVGASVRFGGTADFRFTSSPELQNASTADPRRNPTAVTPATSLLVRGGARIEPVGMGGVLGKGLYLDGFNDYVQMSIPAQAGLRDWYMGLWIDLRDTALGVRPRTIAYFSDNSWVGLRSASAGEIEIVFFNPVDNSLRSLNATGLINVGQYAHIGLMAWGDAPSRHMRVLVNGTPLGDIAFGTPRPGMLGFDLASLASAGNASDLFIGDPGPAYLGQYGAKRRSFMGWIDELRIYAVSEAELQSPMFAELACNEALGTLVDITPRANETSAPQLTALRALQSLYPEGPSVMCEQMVLYPASGESLQSTMLPRQRDLRLCADRVHKAPRPQADLAARCLRGSLLQPHPLVWNQPRPDESGNSFCLSCHNDSSSVAGLQTAALPEINSLQRWQDPRRQPTNVPARLGGRLSQTLQTAGIDPGDPMDKYFDLNPSLAPLSQ